MRYVLSLWALLSLSACALTSSLEGRVTKFHTLEASPKAYVMIADDGSVGSLEWRSYAAIVERTLQEQGWRPASFETADVAVFLQYQISQGRSVPFSYPVFGPVPSGVVTTTGNVTTVGNMSTINATSTQGSTFGVVGTRTGSQTVFDRAVKVTMFSLPSYREEKEMNAVFEGEIRSTGSTGDLPTVMPALLQGLFSDFPGLSADVYDVAVPVP